MKKLNRKGFTLIELLAVIVILAIVLVVTIPSVLNSMNDARRTSLQNATDTVAEWFTKQYELAVLGTSLGSTSVDSAYTTFVGTGGMPTTKANAKTLTTAVIEAAGINGGTTNVTGTVYLNGNKICVELTAPSGSDFYVNADGTTGNKAQSAGCPTPTSGS